MSTTPIDPEAVDLLDVTRRMAGAFGIQVRAGLLEGKTRLRDWVVRDLDCSQSEAERIVDTLQARGFIRFLVPAATAKPTDAADGIWQLGKERELM
jgi:hypothetical protein